jgi:hypothetical protein
MSEPTKEEKEVPESKEEVEKETLQISTTEPENLMTEQQQKDEVSVAAEIPTLSNVSSSESPPTKQQQADESSSPPSPRRLPSMGDQQPSPAASPSPSRQPRMFDANQKKKKSDVDWNAQRKGSMLVSTTKQETTNRLPAPPSIVVDRNDQHDIIPTTKQQQQLPPSPPSSIVAVFNANTKEGGSMVRALVVADNSSQSIVVIAVVRVFTSKNTKRLLKLPNVVVKVADSHDEAALTHAIHSAHRAFLVTKYWEKFDSWLEESQANIIVRACGNAGVSHLVLSSVEDTKTLVETNKKSQIVPDSHGIIHPKFEGMRNLRQLARQNNVLLTHMLTSYVDQEHSKKSVALIMSERGKLVVSESGI